MPRFIADIQLNQLFYRAAVAPVLASAFSRVALFRGADGSDVLGFDSERSTDHEWALRLVICLAENGREARGGSIDEVLSTRLPAKFRGYSTNFTVPGENRTNHDAR